MHHRIFVFLSACLCVLSPVCAQWRIGATAGVDLNHYYQENGYAYDRIISPAWGGTGGVSAQYDFLNWLGLRMDLNITQRNYSSRYFLRKWIDMDGVEQQEQYRYSNLYLMLPVTVSFSFGGEHVRGYADIGGYMGIWSGGRVRGQMQDEYHYEQQDDGIYRFQTYEVSERYSFDKRRDRLFDAGLAGRIGVIYNAPSHLFVLLEAVCYYGLVNNHKTGSEHIRQPGYHTTAAMQLGVGYRFNK